MCCVLRKRYVHVYSVWEAMDYHIFIYMVCWLCVCVCVCVCVCLKKVTLATVVIQCYVIVVEGVFQTQSSSRSEGPGVRVLEWGSSSEGPVVRVLE